MKPLPDEIELARDVLDKQVIDREDTRMGRVDGVVLEIRDGQAPRVARLELGSAVLARRLHPLAERWVGALRRRIGVQKTGRYRVPWEKVLEITPHELRLDAAAEKTPVFAWERWLRDHVIDHIPRPFKGKPN